jgi:HK97 family phage major capsid protein
MNKTVEDVLSELNNNVDHLIKTHREQLDEMKTKIMRRETNSTLPLSQDQDFYGDAYQKSEFSNYIRTGSDVVFKKSMSNKTGEDGGHLVPNVITMRINDQMRFLSPMRSIAKITTISTNCIDMLIDSKKPDAGWLSADNDNVDETDSPEIRKIKIPVHEIYAKPKASQRLLDDSQINVDDWLVGKIAEKIAALENSAFINGDGTDKPRGFLNYESEKTADSEREYGKLQHFCTGAQGKFESNESAVDILIDIACSLKPIYIRNAKWIMSRSALSVIRKLKNKDGINLWQPSLSESTPPTLLGYPVIIDDDMPALKDDVKSASIAFGDFHCGYQIIDRQGLKILRDPYSSKPFIEFYASKRTGGAVVDFDAIKVLKFE